LNAALAATTGNRAGKTSLKSTRLERSSIHIKLSPIVPNNAGL
jgi:hypothetical protein